MLPREKVTDMTAAMQQHEGIKGNPDEDVEAPTACPRDAKRVVQELGMTRYVDEPRGNKFFSAMRLRASDVRNVMIYLQGS